VFFHPTWSRVFSRKFHQSTINDHHPFKIIGCHQWSLIHPGFGVPNITSFSTVPATV
jgi:hypothetical protein